MSLGFNGDYGVVRGERELRLVVGRGAAHSNMQEEKDKSRNSFLNCRESTDNRGCDRRSNLGLHSRPKVS